MATPKVLMLTLASFFSLSTASESFDQLLGDVTPCIKSCEMTYPLHTYPKVSLSSLPAELCARERCSDESGWPATLGLALQQALAWNSSTASSDNRETEKEALLTVLAAHDFSSGKSRHECGPLLLPGRFCITAAAPNSDAQRQPLGVSYQLFSVRKPPVAPDLSSARHYSMPLQERGSPAIVVRLTDAAPIVFRDCNFTVGRTETPR
ncbi:Transmembrane protein 59 [Branchiostoma belcheri]|nr:Transmembrane protein 59 [Branchiostoma belcheri]